jgi:hypothetical protein
MEASFDSDDRLVVLQVRPITSINDAIQQGKDILLSDEALFTSLSGVTSVREAKSVEANELEAPSEFQAGLSKQEELIGISL